MQVPHRCAEVFSPHPVVFNESVPSSGSPPTVKGRLIPAATGMEYYRRVKIPDEVIEHPVLEGLDSEYTPEYQVEPEFIKDQSAVEQPK